MKFTERDLLIYWLLRLDEAQGRSGWEDRPTEGETCDSLHDFLYNIGYSPYNVKQNLKAKKLMNDLENKFGIGEAGLVRPDLLPK